MHIYHDLLTQHLFVKVRNNNRRSHRMLLIWSVSTRLLHEKTFFARPPAGGKSSCAPPSKVKAILRATHQEKNHLAHPPANEETILRAVPHEKNNLRPAGEKPILRNRLQEETILRGLLQEKTILRTLVQEKRQSCAPSCMIKDNQSCAPSRRRKTILRAFVQEKTILRALLAGDNNLARPPARPPARENNLARLHARKKQSCASSSRRKTILRSLQQEKKQLCAPFKRRNRILRALLHEKTTLRAEQKKKPCALSSKRKILRALLLKWIDAMTPFLTQSV